MGGIYYKIAGMPSRGRERLPLKVGSYLKIADNENAILIAIIENF
jgi:hypothetical protein